MNGKRVFDISTSILGLLVFLIPITLIALMIKLTSRGPIIYWSDRVGKDNRIFRMAKFRTMRVDTPALATHLLANSSNYLIPLGSFLRKSSLDELPQ